MAVGHAHPKIVDAIDRAARTGTHFAVTTETTVALAEELCRRFRLERVRFTNSGTEATMDAIRVARGVTGKDVICKIEGSYHGHHDAVMFSVTPRLDLVATTPRTPAPTTCRPPRASRPAWRSGRWPCPTTTWPRWRRCSPSGPRRSPASSSSR